MAKPARKIYTHVVNPKFTNDPNVVLAAVDKLVDFLKVTLGPKIRHILVDYGYKTELLDDGVSIAEEFELEDEFEDAVVSYVREAASKTDDKAGDGTTTTMVILRRLLANALASGKSYPEVRRELAAAQVSAIEQLKASSVPCDSLETLLKVARTSMDDEQAAEAVANVVWETGAKGAVSITDHVGRLVEYERLEGFTMGRGMLARGMVTDADRQRYFAPNKNFDGPVAIAVVEQVIATQADILPILQAADDAGYKNLVIFCNNVIAEAMGIVALAKSKGQFNICAVPFPGQGEKAKDYVTDICTVTGAKTPVGDFKSSDFGMAERVEVSFDDSTIIGGKGDVDQIAAQIEDLRSRTDASKDPYEQEYYHQRQARLMGGVVMIKVGGVTETETRLKLKKVEDAVNACKCALEEGVSPGAGVALMNLKSGSDLLNSALAEVHSTVMANAEQKPCDAYSHDASVNVLTGEIGNFLDVGVVDATKVLRTAIENAVSIATILFSTSGIITSKRQE